MKTQASSRPVALAAACTLLAICPSLAGPVTVSNTPPTVYGEDIANMTWVGTSTDKTWTDTTNHGQSFKMGSQAGYVLKSFSMQTNTTSQASPAPANKTWNVRVVTINANNTDTTTVVNEIGHVSSGTWNSGDWFTWTLNTPITLNPNTLYGIDVEMTNGGAYQPGIPYFRYNNSNTLANSYRYTRADGDPATISANTGHDRIFVIDLQHPLNPSPGDGATVPAGDLTLGWTNLAPNTGSDVWVDVWFGTSAGAMSKVATTQQNLTSFLVNLPGANTYYWRIDSYLDGAPTGTPVQSPVFSFVVFDSDGDGFPDTYELAHTTPPSATALNVGDDLEPDGLTNWQEYQLGTNPNNPDSDNDGLNDGPELTGVGLRPPTSPTKDDTDGDGIKDGVESNSGIWVGAADTGTNPVDKDTDHDGLPDGVETHTGTYVSTSNTGTNPLNPNSDGDNADDWYEVAIIDKKPALGSPPNSPNDANIKPNIPYPLPDPDPLDTGVATKPVRVYIMSGQSNMVGFGTVNGSGPGTLQTMTGVENKFPNLVAGGGGWTVQNDVKYRGVISDTGSGSLKPDVSGTQYGPELGFGYVMGYVHDEPVLLIKASQGNRGLMWDLLPPGSPRTVYGATTYPAYGESPETWATSGGGPTPFVWYAGKQYDDFFLKENDMGPVLPWAIGTAFPSGCQLRHNGVIYISKSAHTGAANSEPGVGMDSATYWNVYSVFNTADILDDFANQYPAWAAQGFEIAGYVWWQGYDDTGEPRSTRYEPNMVQFIKQVRLYYENRYPGKVVPNAPFVLATLATNGGWGNTDPGSAKVAQAQLNVDGSTGLHPEFTGNVKTVEARGFWRDASVSPNNVGYHYNFNAETYLLVGDALGRAMVELESSAPPPAGGYAAWLAGPFSGTLSDSNPGLDFDGGGLKTGLEWVLGGDPTSGADDASIAPVINNSDPNSFVFTFKRSDNANADANTSITVEYGSDLAGWTPATHGQNGVTIDDTAVPLAGFHTVVVTIPKVLAPGGRLFARLRVGVILP